MCSLCGWFFVADREVNDDERIFYVDVANVTILAICDEISVSISILIALRTSIDG